MAQKKAKNMNNLYSGGKNMKFCKKRDFFFHFFQISFMLELKKKYLGFLKMLISKNLNFLFKKMAS